MVVEVSIDEVSAKVRQGPPSSEPVRDRKLQVWAGVIPIRLEAGDPVPDTNLPSGIAAPASVSGYQRPRIR